MIGDRLYNDIRPARLLGWKTIRILQGFARFQEPRDRLDEADATIADLAELLGPCSRLRSGQGTVVVPPRATVRADTEPRSHDIL